ncbi:50S ribosomal protein L11 methyltransferase [Flavobacteriales bacterium]|nr:50S ribosomal protein L11 methyltransferase [Flavobacteriales bacterium]|tara:strand:+ start:3219 stop:4049 length:831 start_codon:yes stop_codon:yes gene_type:complete
MEYTELDIVIKDVKPFSEILIARLNDIDFETFEENINGVKCYIQSQFFDLPKTQSILNKISTQTSLQYSINKIAQKNWNAEWEKNFHPIIINSRCSIRADFHQPLNNVEDEIIITPKMSFGTGHHETTSLMINELYNIDLKNTNVLDMGCGTGILSIVASKRGAKKIVAIDIDDWAYQNAIENSNLNNIKNIDFLLGDIDKLNNLSFDIVLANINRNIILRDLSSYYNFLSSNGDLIISGFLIEDVNLILKDAKNLGFNLINKKNKNQWYILHLRK